MELILLERGTLALVDADVRDRLSAAYAELKGTWSASTERSIESDLRVFCSWCASVNAAILPAQPQTVVQFIEAQAANEKTVATIRRYIYSIAVLHRLGQCSNPTKHASVTTALKRIVRELGTEQVQQGPLRWEHIEPALERLDTSMPRDAFAAALVCVAYDALCRPEELPRIHVEHLMKDDDGHSLRIIKSKTDQSKRGVKVFLSATTYERVVHWLRLAAIAAGPVFCAREGRAVTDATVRRTFKRIAQLAGIDETHVSGHSCRIGAAQDLAANGAGLPELMTAGRWNDARMVPRYTAHQATSHGAMAKLAAKQKRQ